VTGQPANTRKSIVDPDFNNFAPRIGFAYQATPKTTVRGGYSIFYATNYLWEVQGPRGQWPYAIGENPNGLNTGINLTPLVTFFSPNTNVTPNSKPNAVFALGRRNRTSYTQQWNLGVQRELARDLLLEVDYVGTKGTKMPVFLFLNAPPPGPGVVGSPQHPRPYPQQNSVIIESDNLSTSIYHSMQVKLEKRFSNGLQFMGSYAWAHYIDIGGAGNSSASFPPDPNNIDADRASGAFDFRHIFTASYFYQLPFGRGRRFLPQVAVILNQLVGVLEVTGITHYNSGPPVNLC
jgi:hypothetical protein